MVHYESHLIDLVHDRDLIIFDFDGVVSPDSPEFDMHRQRVGAEAALRMLKASFSDINLTLEEVIELNATLSGKDEVDYKGFCKHYGLDQDKWHHDFNDNLNVELAPPTQITAEHFEACPFQMAILSHANRGWIIRKLEKDGRRHFFPDDKIFALEDVDNYCKFNGTEAYCRVLEKLDVEPRRAIMVENQPRNLVSAHKLGIETILVAQKNGNGSKQYDHVDYVFPGATQFLESVTRVKPLARKFQPRKAGLQM